MTACPRCPRGQLKEAEGRLVCFICGYGTMRSGLAKTRRKGRPPYPRRQHATAPTSRASYAGLHHVDTQAQYSAVLKAVDAHPEGLTRREIAQASGVGYEAVCGRVDELMGKKGRGPFTKDPLLAELPTTRKNKDTGISAAVIVRASRLKDIAGVLF